MTNPGSVRRSLIRTCAMGAFVAAACAVPPMLGAQVPHARQPVIKAPPTARVPTGLRGTVPRPAGRNVNPRVIGTLEPKVARVPAVETPHAAPESKATRAPAAAKKTKTTAKKKKGASKTPDLPDTKSDTTRRKP